MLSLVDYNKGLYTKYCARAGEGRSWSKDTSDLQERTKVQAGAVLKVL